MAGLVPAIHVRSHAPVPKALFRTPLPPAETMLESSLKRLGVDGRDKPGQDGED
jgi:hypothetical protein